MKSILFFIYSFVLGFAIVNQGYAQPSMRIDELERKIKNSVSDTNRVELLNALYDEVERTNTIRAKTHADEALKIAQSINYTKGITESTERIAQNYEKQGVFSKALVFYEQALKLRQKANQNEKVADIYNKIGRISLKQGNAKQAIEYFQTAINLYEKTATHAA